MGRVSVAGFAPDETILSSQDGRERLGEQCLPSPDRWPMRILALFWNHFPPCGNCPDTT